MSKKEKMMKVVEYWVQFRIGVYPKYVLRITRELPESAAFE